MSDTIGIAQPGQVSRVLERLLATVPADRIALHFHDTRGTALANVLAALAFGIATFDASAGDSAAVRTPLARRAISPPTI